MAASNEISLLVIKFRIGGSLRFLSHAETVRVFQRACVRAGISVQYSKGFNPRPKLSLPLPRPVGVESDDELLCLKIHKSMRAQGHKSTRNANDLCTDDLCSFVKAELSPELPKGCELLSVNIAKANTSFQPCSATYVLAVRKEYLSGKLKAAIARLLASESLKVQRQIDKRRTKVKNLDVREFLKSIKLDDRSIIVECRISSAGSIRVEEILTLLGLSEYKLAAPIRRTSVQWQEA
ncbi:MAG: TIGR03936 family radical SAM-associated protein [Planctomycetota bacterium]